MRTITNLPKKALLVGSLLAASAVGLMGCSSGSTTAGIGLDVAGLWSGTFQAGSARHGLTIQISQAQPLFVDDNVIATQEISGVVSVADSAGACLSGGVLTGTIGGSTIDFVAGNTTFSGTYANGRMSGLWSAECSPSSGSWEIR